VEEAVVVDSVRTPLAKSYRGSLNATRSDDMVAHCLRSILDRRPALRDGEIDDVILGCGYPEGTQGRNVGRMAALRAGLPTSVPGMTLNRFCSSGLQAIAIASHQIMHEGSRAVLAGGVESITGMADARRDKNSWLEEHFPGVYLSMGQTAEIVAKRYKIGRQSQDEYSLESQKRTARAVERGYLGEKRGHSTLLSSLVGHKGEGLIPGRAGWRSIWPMEHSRTASHTRQSIGPARVPRR
jgi:acetyl-CoA acetyltransferase